MRALATRLLCVFPLLSAACVSTTEELSQVQPVAVTELERWRVELDGKTVGTLRKMRLEHPEVPDLFYLVENASGTQAGMIDTFGRAYRDAIFTKQRELVGMGSMAEDLRLLLELPRRPDVVPWPRGASETPEKP